MLVIAQEPHAGGPGTLPAVALGSPHLLPHLWLAGRSLTTVFYLPCSWSPPPPFPLRRSFVVWLSHMTGGHSGQQRGPERLAGHRLLLS